MFGDVIETPQTEKTPFQPQSPYACAKVYAFHQTVNYRHGYDMFAANGILFTRAATRIKLGLQEKLYLGNLDAKRDWGYAKDYVEGMWMMLQHDTPDDFVLATGETQTIRQFLDFTFESLDLDWNKYVEIDPRYFRPTEVNLLLGDPSKAKKELGWEAKTSCKQLAELMVSHDLELAKQEAAKNCLT